MDGDTKWFLVNEDQNSRWKEVWDSVNATLYPRPEDVDEGEKPWDEGGADDKQAEEEEGGGSAREVADRPV